MAGPSMKYLTVWDFLSSPATPIQGIASPTPAWVGAAASTSFRQFYGEELFNGGANLNYARVVAEVNPNTQNAPGSPTGIVIQSYDYGTGVTTNLFTLQNTGTGPQSWAQDITAHLQACIANKRHVQIGYAAFGNGSDGALIHGFRVEMGWL